MDQLRRRSGLPASPVADVLPAVADVLPASAAVAAGDVVGGDSAAHLLPTGGQ